MTQNIESSPTRATGSTTEGRGASARWSTAWGGFFLLEGEFQLPFKPHLHTWHIVGLVDRGSMVLARGARRWTATAGDVIVLRPHEVHADQALDGRPYRLRMICAGIDVVRAAVGPALCQALRGSGDPVVHSPPLAEHVGQVFEALWRPSGADAPAELAVVLRVLARLRARQPGCLAATAIRRRLTSIREYLHRAPADAVGIDRLAVLAGMSPFHLVRSFHSLTGLAPHAYYQQLRVARAKQLLWRGQGLSDIAFSLGFSDHSHFTREFKRTTQIPPSRYAAMARAAGGPGAGLAGLAERASDVQSG